MHRSLRSALVVTTLLAAGLVPATAGARTPDGTPGLAIVGWGETWEGQASPPPLPTGAEVVDVAGGWGWSAALLGDGHVVTWGEANMIPTKWAPPDLDKHHFTAFEAGRTDIAAITDDGHVVTWGVNTMLYALDSHPAGLDDEVVTDVAIGENHVVALTREGKVHSWGRNQYGQTDVPASLADETVVRVAALDDRSIALTDDGEIVQWGGYVPASPPPAPEGATYVDVSAGYPDLALTDTGQVVQWGSASESMPPVPPTPAGSTIVAISAGTTISAALTDRGQVLSWGDDRYWDPSVPEAVRGRTAHAVAATEGGAVLAVLDGAFTQPTATVTGTAVVGQTLTAATASTPEATSTDLQWLRDGVEIPGATSSTRLVNRYDRGAQLTVRATFHREGYDDAVAVSTPTAAVRMPAQRFTVDTSRDRVARGSRVTVTARGLAAGETYRITIASRRTATGTADSRGRLTRGVTVPRATPLGWTRVAVTGWQTDRAGSHRVRVVRR